MERIYILLIEDEKQFFVTTEEGDLPFEVENIVKVDILMDKHRFITESLETIDSEIAKERYAYFIRENQGIVVKLITKQGPPVYLSAPWNPEEDKPERTKEIMEIFDSIEDLVVNQLGEE